MRQLAAAGMTARRRLAEFADHLEREGRSGGVRERARLHAGEAARTLASLQGIAAGAREALAARRGSWSERLSYYGLQLRGDSLQARLSRLAAALEATAPVEPVLGAELSYVEGGGPAASFPSTQIVPAYAAAAAASGSALEDTTQGREIEDGPELRAKAATLRTAKAAYEFVKSQAKQEWYAGGLKGTTETLRDLRGNDVDLAGLLIALLRAQGTPARYVQGTIELPAWRMADLLGLLTAAEQVQASQGGGLAPPVETRLFRALSAAGITVQPVVSGGRVTAVRWLHTWAEAFVPYADYRGAGRGAGARQWVPIDPVIQGGAKLAATPPAEDVFSATGLTADELQDRYLGTSGEGSPLQLFRSVIEERLAQRRPGLTYTQLLRTVEAVPEPLPFLPGSLPFTVVSTHAEYAFLPEADKHRVRIQVADAAGPFLDVTVPTHQLAGRRTLLTFEPATDDDRYAIDSAGGIYQVAAAAVAVKPLLTVGGQVAGQATRAVGLGAKLRWSFELLLPGGGSRPIENGLIAGNVVAIGVGSPVNRFDPARDEAETFDSPAGSFLYRIAADYANGWTEGEDELARLLQVAAIRPTANVVFVSNKLVVDEALGVVRRLIWKGIQIDADHRALQPVELLAGRGRDLLQLSGLEGSYQEARVLTAATTEEAISAATVIQEARRQGVEVLRLRGGSPALARLVTTPPVQREVLDQLARGREVIIPATDLTIRDWTGAGFIARDTATGEGGYFLSGIISGGQTIVSPLSWTDKALVDTLGNPTQQQPETDLSKVARIIKVSGDFQRTTVGSTAPKPIRVLVTTLAGRPVLGAPVTFRAVGGAKAKLLMAGTGVGSDLPLSVTTNGQGYAEAYVTADQVILNAAVVEIRTPNDALVGANEVMAEVVGPSGSIAVPQPFVITGTPDVPAIIELPCSLLGSPGNLCARRYPVGIQLGQALWARVVDKYGNRLANQRLTWSSNGPAGLFVNLALADAAGPKVLDPNDPALTPTLSLITGTDGLATTDFVPGMVGRLTLNVTQGTISAGFGLDAEEPAADERFIFRLKSRLQYSFAGVRGMAFQAPMGGQVLAWSGSPSKPWVPITGREPGMPKVFVQMKVWDVTSVVSGAGNGTFVRSETHAPTDVLPGLAGDPREDDTTAMFWPSYEVEGVQRVVFSATITKPNSGPVELRDTYFLDAISRAPAIKRFRVLPGAVEVPTDALGAAGPDDLAVVFKVNNPASFPIYARVLQLPQASGETLVDVPPPDVAPRHPLDPSLIRLLPELTTSLRLGVRPSTKGGAVELELIADDPTGPGALLALKAADRRIELPPAGFNLLGSGTKVRAEIIVPVRNFESTATPPPGENAPPTATEDPILVPGRLTLHLKGAGQVTLSVNGVDVGGAEVVADVLGIAASFAPLGTLPPPVLTAQGGFLFVLQPNLSASEVTARFVPADGSPPSEQTWPFITEVTDAGALPIGHTFVKDVSVVDGHLARQFTDLSVPGRGAGLAFTRSYTSRGSESGPLGRGWTHSWRSWVTRSTQGAKLRYLVAGGEGTGQVFDCTAGPCRNQRGFHGTLQPSQAEVVYTAPNGVKHHYGRLDAGPRGERYWLTSIEDPRGNVTTLEYGSSPEVLRVWEPGNRRVLQLTYSTPSGNEGPQLDHVELLSNPGADPANPSLLPIDDDGPCVAFGYDAYHNLAVASRRGAGCAASGVQFRSESFEYVASDNPVISDNLLRYTNPDGRVVEYQWYSAADAISGESQFLLMGDKVERVKAVKELSAVGPTVVTSFDFRMKQLQVAQFGQVQPMYETWVTGPRPGVPPTVYRLDPYGASAQVERPVSPGQVAAKQTRWDPVHIRPLLEQDPLGRQTSFAYDVRGNLIERRVTTSLPAGAPATLEAVKRDGVEVAATIERWAYDPQYGGETCHVDPEGRVSVTSYELGLPKAKTGFATPLTAAQVAGEGTCEAMAALVTPSPRDQIVEHAYCTTDTCTLPLGARRGDLQWRVEHGRGADQGFRRIVAGEYDLYGYPRLTTADPGGASVVTTTVFDGRGRLTDLSDSTGHHTATWFDGLDRPKQIDRFNTVGGSPGERRTLTYYDGGALQTEQVERAGGGGGLLARTIGLDGLGRPSVFSEKDLVSGLTLTSTVEYDEAGNKEVVTDRRGVRTRTVFDHGDRPVETWVSVRSQERPRFEVDGGDVTRFDLEQRVFRAGFDVAGNKVWESDLHGHQTDYTLDTLYRVVRVTQPQTVDESGAPVRYQVARAYDLVGNKVLETDGNGNSTRYVYDFGNRTSVITDALGRSVSRDYDGTGALRVEKTLVGGVEQVRRELTYDGLGRPLDTTETWAVSSGTRSRSSSTRYDDVAHRVLSRDVRGVVTVRKLDDLDRVFSETADTTDGLLGRTFASTPAVVAETSFEYDAMGRQTAIVDALGRRTDEHIDAFGRVTSRVRPMGVTETFRYDGEGQLVERQDGRGVHWKTYRDPLGRVTMESVIEVDASELALKRSQYTDDVAPLVYEFDARGNLTTRTLDALHREVKVVDAEGGTVETRHDAVNRRRASDPRKYQTWLAYDAVNRPTGQEDHAPGGGLLYTQTTSYRDAPREEEHVSRAGLTTLTTHDGLGRAVRVERSGTGDDGAKLTAADVSEFDAAGNLTLKTDANGHATRYELDGLGRKVAETLADGTAVAARTTSTYDKVGNRLEVKGPRGSWAYDLHQDYDDLNRPVRTVDATGAVTTTAFDAGGNKVCELRPSGGDLLGAGGAARLTIDALQSQACGKPASTGFTYDELGKLTGVETASGLTTFVYDEARNLVAKQDANAHLTIYAYDRANRRTDEWQQLDAQARLTSRSQVAALQRTVLPDAGFTTGTLHWSASYDLTGNVTQVTEPKGDVRVSTYGALNRLGTTTFTQHDKPLGVVVPTSTTTGYDGDGKVKTVIQVKSVSRTFLDVDSTVTEVTTAEHDGLGRLWREHRYDGKVVEYAYDLKGNRKKVTDPDGVETSYDYDAADRLATVTTPRGAATYAHWPDGLRKGTSLPNGLGEGRCYDPAGRVTAIVTRTGAVADTCPDTLQDQSRFRYGYDANGNRLTQQEWRTDPATQALGAMEETSYGYDAVDRLVGVQYPGGKAELYRLDPVGNRTGERELSGAALSAAELTSFEPPAGATLVRDVTGTFNRADWLTALTDAKDAARAVSLGWTASGELRTKTTATVSRQLTWDGRGALVAVADNGVEVGRYDYDADGLRVKRRTAAENVEYVLDDTHVIQETDANVLEHPAYRRYHYGAEPLMVVDGARARFIGTDALGSPTDLTGTTGQVEAKRQYDAWGRYRNGTAPGAGEAKLGFTGHQFDPETGLVYARARYYDPEIGRFISRDTFEMPVEGAPHLHRFIYGENRPTVYVDESGHVVPLIVVGAMLIAANWDFWHQQNVNQTASVDDIWNKTSFGEVGLAAAGGGAAALTGVGAGALAAAGAGALGAGAVGTGIAAGAVGGGVTAGLDSLSGQAIEVGAGRADSINWGKVGTDTAVGVAVGGVLGGVAGKVSSELDKFGKELAGAAAKGFQEGAAEVAGIRGSATIVESAVAPGAVAAPQVERVFYVDPAGVAVPARPGSVFRGTAVTPSVDEAITREGFRTGMARGVVQGEGAALPRTASLEDRLVQYVEGSPFPRDADFVGFKRVPHDALRTAAGTGRAVLRDPSAYMRLDEVDTAGLRTIDVEAMYRGLGRAPRPPLDVSGEVVVEGSVPPIHIRKTNRWRP